ncbi:hypothetical protein FRC12_015916 [Ceratobasidium sp. 428]|nr:hypothetical protein FRC12_015916 [Ceratobasidium sp. 428]
MTPRGQPAFSRSALFAKSPPPPTHPPNASLRLPLKPLVHPTCPASHMSRASPRSSPARPSRNSTSRLFRATPAPSALPRTANGANSLKSSGRPFRLRSTPDAYAPASTNTTNACPASVVSRSAS